jgi:two-component system chemotaxis response regulator CheB
MDIHMPVLDGLEATKEIMREAPTPIIVVTAGTSAADVEAGLCAVRQGALTVLQKPVGPAGPGFDEAARHLVDMVKALADVKVIRRRVRDQARSPVAGNGVDVVAVAASTGGPPALCGFLQRLPADLPVPLVVVQHIVEGFLPGLVGWLRAEVPFRVCEAVAGQRLEAGTVYLAGDGAHVEVDSRLRVRHTFGEPVDGFRPSATVLFRSVARAFGPTGIAVVLTGMGNDGLDGARAMRAAGGRVLAQDEYTSVVHGMPGVVVKAGLADEVGPVEKLAASVAAATGGRVP